MRHPVRVPTRLRRLVQRAAHAIAPDAALVGWPPEVGPRRGQRPSRATRPHVGIVGFYGPGNYGDELFLEVFREHLGADIDLDVVFDSPTRPYFSRAVRDVVREHDAIVIGGGDLIIPWSLGDRYWLTDYLRRPVHVIGVGVPTFRPPKTSVVTALSRYLRHGNVRSISVRDEESAAWIREHIRPTVEVEVAADLVFAMSLPAVDRPVDPPILGLTVRWQDGGDYAAVRALAERGRGLGYRLRTIALATDDVRRRDQRSIDQLGLRGDDVEHVASDDLEVLTRAIGECTMLASNKFHGSVVATAYGVPSISMSTSDKNRNLMRRLGRPEFVCGFNDPALPDRLTRPPTPIDLAVRDAMARDARASLVRLRDRILAG